MDEFKSQREKEEAAGRRMGADDGFQMVYGKKKKKVEDGGEDGGGEVAEAGVRMVSRDKKTTAARAKVPFHIPSIPRPQDEYKILVNNSTEPFKHVWLEKSEDGSRDVHPLEKLSLLDFIDRNVVDGDPVKPLSLDSTPFQLVAGVKELKELAAKLRGVNEFAVDLEHNSYRSYQGLTCLMQISTRAEDFVIDTLKLRVHVGPHLREVFKDPTKRKVMHGADRDIIWLQKDFGIYVCNLFDTGQASRVMQLERNSLEYLLHHFCGVDANKEYQNADWRLRPLPAEMVKYAREDTHYLLHIFDLMKKRLLAASSPENDLLLEVYKRSYDVCMQFYEKELLTDTSFLHIYGLREADFNSNQLAIVFGLCEWRDKIAREEDESTGYILPNKALLEIARHMPLSSGKLRRLVRSKYPYVERHLNSVIGIIRSSIENSSSFESIAEQLKMMRQPAVQNAEPEDNSESLCSNEDLMELPIGSRDAVNYPSNIGTSHNAGHIDVVVKSATTKVSSSQMSLDVRCQHEEKLQPTLISESVCSFKLPSTDEKEKMDCRVTDSSRLAEKPTNIPSVQVSKRQSSAFGAMLGSSSRRKSNPYNGGTIKRSENVDMVEQIKSSLSMPFHSFTGGDNSSKPIPKAVVCLNPHQDKPEESMGQQPTEITKLEEIIQLENKSDSSQSDEEESLKGDDGPKHRPWFPKLPENDAAEASESGPEMEEGQMSLSDLSSSFQECFQSINEKRGSKPNQRPILEAESTMVLRPFDYDAARINLKIGQDGEADRGVDGPGAPHLGSGERRRDRASKRSNDGAERSAGFQAPRRRQAFPVSGNRSRTF